MRVNAAVSVLLPIMAVTLLAAGCGEGMPTEPIHEVHPTLDAIGEDPSRALTELPFKLDAEATLVSQVFAPGFGPPDFGKDDFGGRCSAPSDFLIRFSLDAEATHLGALTGVAEHCTRIDFMTGHIAIIDGELTLTAANGDEMWDRYSGEGGAATATIETHVFVGGTGRFVGATGGGSGHPDCDPATGACVLTLEGTIVYDASDRRQ
jgi:hypothetical protein